MKSYKRKTKHLLLALGLFFNSFVVICFSYNISFLIDKVLIGNKIYLFKYWIIAAVFIAMVSSFTTIFLGKYLPIRNELIASIYISKNALINLLNLNYKNYSKKDKGFYYNVVTNSAFSYGSIAIELYVRWVSNLMIVIFVIGVIFHINKVIGILFMLYIPLALFASSKPSELIAEYQEKGLPTQDLFLNETRSIIESKREINISKTKKVFINRFNSSSYKYLDFVTRFKLYEILSTSIPEIITKFYSLLILSISAYMGFNSKLTVGQVLFLYQLINFISRPISELVSTIVRKQANQANINRIDLLEKESKESSGFEDIRTSDTLISSNGFSMYKNNEKTDLLFRMGSIDIPVNSFVIIKGENGSGKSMLINYITGNLAKEFGQGNLSISKDIDNYSYLTYPILIVNGGFKDNLLGIEPEPKVYKMLNIDFDRKQITNNPVNLSFGQQQKLNLLRVLSQPSDYIFLDEPMLNLDKMTQNNVVKYLDSIKGTKTIVAVMHDESLDYLADYILDISKKTVAISEKTK
ncbi:ABC transporter ATP-binding protein [Tissierella praeacuta]|uniref:ABC transporter ATP-binding protein n=1 Tax=Tissierella praeacuta TaxID=43131 RepID=UPI002FDB7B79